MSVDALELPVEDVQAGDVVHVGRMTGWRPVIRVDVFDGHRGDPDAKSYVVVYKPASLGETFENRATAKRGAGYFHRDEASLACKAAGDLVSIRRTGGTS